MKPNFNIPSSFMLFGEEWQTEFIDDPKNSTLLGECEYTTCKIRLQVRHDLDEVHPSKLEGTFYHELVHAIFEAGCYHDLTSNENLVQHIGGCLHQFMKTRKD
jgi:hypothetical protein